MNDFTAQVNRYKDEFYRYILRTVWDSSVADDVFSNAVLAAWENRHKFTPGTNFRAWMYRIITNKCFVANREISRTPQPLESAPATALLEMDQEPGYTDLLEHPEEVLEQCGDEVYLAMRKLSTAQRSCLLLKSVERMSYKEIAEILEIPLGTVMTHLSRGRAKLRKELLEYARARGIVRSAPRILRKKTDEAHPQDKVEGNSV